MGQSRQPDDFCDNVKTQTERFPRELKHQRSSSTSAVSATTGAALSVERCAFFRVCCRLLAIATLNGFGQRGDLLDSGCEIFCSPRLLLGGGCRLG